MAIDVVLQPVNSGYNVSVINDNFVEIEQGLRDVLSRSGDTPNQMNTNIDMNGYSLLNVGTLNVSQIVTSDGDLPVITQGLSEWDTNTPYGVGDLVVYDNVLYLSLTENEAIVPSSSPSDWDIVLKGGTDGQDGSDGALSGVENIKTSAYTIVSGDSGKIIVANSSSPITFSLSPVASLGSEFVVIVKNIGSGLLTIDPNGSETIDGSTTYTVPTGVSLMVNGNGSVFKTFFRDTPYTLPNATDTSLGGVELATAAEIRSGDSGALAITPSASLASAAYVAVTYASTITLNHNEGFHRSVTLTGNPTFANPTNVRVGYPLVIAIKQDATGNRVPTWGTNFKTGGANIVLSTAANVEDLVIFHARSATQLVYLGIIKGIQ
jgi:hypothetical protein